MASSMLAKGFKQVLHTNQIRYLSVGAQRVSETLTEVSKLSNGVQVATQEAGSAGDLTTVSVYVGAGSRHENPANNGAASLLAHSQLQSAPLKQASAALGGEVKAYTGREHTVYYATVLKDQVGEAMEALTKCVSTVQGSSEVAKAAVEAELAAKDLRCESNLMEDLHDAAYLDTPMGLPIKGTSASVASLDADQLEAFRSSTYTAPRLLVAAAGAVNHAEIVSLSDKLLGTMNGTAEVPTAEARFVGSDKRTLFDSSPVAHVAVAFETEGANSAMTVPLMLIKTVLGSWDTTATIGKNSAWKLTQWISEGNLAYSYKPFHCLYKDSGLFGIQWSAKDCHQEDLMYAATYQLMRTVHQLTDEEVERAKVCLKAELLAKTGSTASIVEGLGTQMLAHGRHLSLAELFTRIDDLSVLDVKECAKAVINDKDHALAAIGPIHELPDYNWIRRRSYWLRY
eukprot:CAMPEP_0113943084 /NCGR_PEP_ID=MMETSP1339-20121228/19165_1 /TAXON_ID=94617 /ORGANISM="Fibrocapsa japonica" /LENGTH=455 /DNA_ID=CAMNT_0000947849 /DNA_START=60 /DNA_END=1427 /DNA_ORIENTATION=- /assembly_acc=CAM_ASM_000762